MNDEGAARAESPIGEHRLRRSEADGIEQSGETGRIIIDPETAGKRRWPAENQTNAQETWQIFWNRIIRVQGCAMHNKWKTSEKVDFLGCALEKAILSYCGFSGPDNM